MTLYSMVVFAGADQDGHRYGFRCDDYDDPRFPEILAWMREEFGPDDPTGTRAGTRWCFSEGSHNIWMRDEIDAFAFKMKWC